MTGIGYWKASSQAWKVRGSGASVLIAMATGAAPAMAARFDVDLELKQPSVIRFPPKKVLSQPSILATPQISE